MYVYMRYYSKCVYTGSIGIYLYDGLATISRLLKIICLFGKRALSKRQYSAKKTNDFKELNTCSHHINTSTHIYHIYIHIHVYTRIGVYAVASISGLLKILGLFSRISSFYSGSFAKETYDFMDLNVYI